MHVCIDISMSFIICVNCYTVSIPLNGVISVFQKSEEDCHG